MTERPTSAAGLDHSASEREAMRKAIYASVRSVAPEFDPSSIDARRPLRDEADIDSFDFLNLLIDLQAHTGIEVPEADYARVGTLDAMLAYLLERRGTDDASSTPAA